MVHAGEIRIYFYVTQALIRRSRRFAISLVTVCLFAASGHAQGPAKEREVSGNVVNAQHQPVRGAIVQLENETTTAVTTYLTDADGHYHFKRLTTSDDYKLSATFQGRKSAAKELSKFSSKTEVFVRLVIPSD